MTILYSSRAVVAIEIDGLAVIAALIIYVERCMAGDGSSLL